jgi:hypothetical protein
MARQAGQAALLSWRLSKPSISKLSSKPALAPQQTLYGKCSSRGQLWRKARGARKRKRRRRLAALTQHRHEERGRGRRQRGHATLRCCRHAGANHAETSRSCWCASTAARAAATPSALHPALWLQPGKRLRTHDAGGVCASAPAEANCSRRCQDASPSQWACGAGVLLRGVPWESTR